MNFERTTAHRACYYAIARSPISPSITRMDQSKAVEVHVHVRITQFSPQSSLTPLVFVR